MLNIKRIYDTRFTRFERIKKKELWKILCRDFLQQFVKAKDTVVDLGAGQCEFINNIQCKQKIAVDISEDINKYAAKNVRIVRASVKYLKNIFQKANIDVIFMSNLLEHMDSKEEVFRLLNEAHTVLRKGGRLLIMQPDIGLVGHEYWDFFDHKVPITLASLTEVLLTNKFRISYIRYPFLPYTIKTKYLPMNPFLLRIYLKISLLQRIFGKQFFLVAEK